MTDQSQPTTAPHLAGIIVAAILVVIGLHFAGFHFVMSGGVGR